MWKSRNDQPILNFVSFHSFKFNNNIPGSVSFSHWDKSSTKQACHLKKVKYSNVEIEILNYGNLSRWHCCCLGRTHFLKLEPFTLHNQRVVLPRNHHKSFEHRSTFIFPESAIDENSTGPSVLKSGPFGVGILFDIVLCDVLSFLRKRHRATNSIF